MADLCHLDLAPQTDKQTNKQMDSAVSRSRCRERRLNKRPVNVCIYRRWWKRYCS